MPDHSAKSALPKIFWVLIGGIFLLVSLLAVGTLWENQFFAANDGRNPKTTPAELTCHLNARQKLKEGEQVLGLQSVAGNLVLWTQVSHLGQFVRAYLKKETDAWRLYRQNEISYICSGSKTHSCLSSSEDFVVTDTPFFDGHHFVFNLKNSARQMSILGQIDENQSQLKRILGFCGQDLSSGKFVGWSNEKLLYWSDVGFLGILNLDRPHLFHSAMAPGHFDLGYTFTPEGLWPFRCPTIVASARPESLTEIPQSRPGQSAIATLLTQQNRHFLLVDDVGSSVRGQPISVKSIGELQGIVPLLDRTFATLQSDWLANSTRVSLLTARPEKNDSTELQSLNTESLAQIVLRKNPLDLKQDEIPKETLALLKKKSWNFLATNDFFLLRLKSSESNESKPVLTLDLLKFNSPESDLDDLQSSYALGNDETLLIFKTKREVSWATMNCQSVKH